MSRHVTSLLLAAAFFMSNTTSSFADPICSDALITTTTTSNYDRVTTLVALSSVNSTNYEESKKKLKAKVPGYFDGDYGEFEKKRAGLNKYNATYFDDKLLTSDTRHFLSPVALEAYRACLDTYTRTREGFYLIVRSAEKKDAVVEVFWNAPPTAKPEKLEMEISGGKIQQKSRITRRVIPDATTPFIITREIGEPISLVAALGGMSSTVALPKFVRITAEREVKPFESREETAICRGGGGRPEDLCVSPDNGYEFVEDSIIPILVSATGNIDMNLAKSAGVKLDPSRFTKLNACVVVTCYPLDRQGGTTIGKFAATQEKWTYTIDQ